MTNSQLQNNNIFYAAWIEIEKVTEEIKIFCSGS